MIRKANINDIEKIAEIYEAIHAEESAGRMVIGWAKGIYPVKQTALDALGRDDLFVQEQDGKVVASAIINHIQVSEYAHCPWEHPAADSEVMVLHTLVVHPAENGKGYAKEFVRYYENYALEKGCKYLRMDTQYKNSAARSLYSKLGYKEPGIVYCVFNGIPDVKLVCLEKHLG